MFKYLQINHLSSLHKAYALIIALFLLSFFLLPNNAFPDDKLLHKFFLFAVLLFFPLIIKDIWHNTALLTHPLIYCMLAYFFYSALSGLWTLPIEMSIPWQRPIMRSLYILVFCLAIAWLNLRAPEFFERLLTILLIVATVVALAGIIYWWVAHGGNFNERLVGITRAEHSIQGAASFAVIFILAFVRFAKSKVTLEKVLYAAAALICLLFVILAQTRGVLVAMAAAMFMFFILRRNIKLFFILIAAAFVLLIVGYFWLDWSQLWNGLTRSMPYRMEMWDTMIREGLERPWFGHGFLHDSSVPVGDKVFPHAHNIYVSIFFFKGIVGLFLYGLMVFCALYYAYLNGNNDTYLFAGLVIVFACVAMLSDIGRVIARPSDLWFYFWFPIGIILSTSHR